MIKKVVVVLLAIVVLGLGCKLWDKVRFLSSKKEVTIVLSGFGGGSQLTDFSGETAPFLRIMEKRNELSDKFLGCELVYEGTIYKQKVVVAASGMGKVTTNICLNQLVENYGNQIKEVIFVGIAGISPVRVGNAGAAMLGDVCINYVAFDFDLQHYTADKAGTAEKNPQFWATGNKYGSQYTVGNSVLAYELYRVALSLDSLEVPEKVVEVNKLYTGYSRKTKIWGPRECIEATSDLYWHDSSADERARQMGAKYLEKIIGEEVLAENIVVVTSMEASAVGAMIDAWNKSQEDTIAFAYVRGASNYDRAMVNFDGIPIDDGQASLGKMREIGGSAFAIENAARPVLKLLEMRGK